MRINRTHSLPKGIYWVADKAPERGDIVAFWPQVNPALRLGRERGYIIPGAHNKSGGVGYGLLLKRRLGLPGDIVSTTDNGIIINGKLAPNTKPLDPDNIGDPLPRLRFDDYRLAENEALFVSDHLPRSFDARRFWHTGNTANCGSGCSGVDMVRSGI
jgi:conjugative transfer signal peptidase TraF